MLRGHKSQHLAACKVMSNATRNIPKPPPIPLNRPYLPKPPLMPKNRSDGLHTHCSRCVIIGKCVQSSKICPVVYCLLECGSRFHLCKEDEHRDLCPNLRVRCWFLSDGCQKTMLRSERAHHVAVCEVINRSNRSHSQPFPTIRSNIPNPPPPPPPMNRSCVHKQPSLSMNISNIPHPPPLPMNRKTNVPKPPTYQLNTSIIPTPPPIPGNRPDGPHKHCLKCFSPGKCGQTKCCPVVFCALGCGALYHTCKDEQHQELCPSMVVPCINLNNGCRETMLRGERSCHLAAACEVIRRLAPLAYPSEKPGIPRPPPKVNGKMVMGKFVSIPPPPPGLFVGRQTINPPPVNRKNLPKPPTLHVNRSSIPKTPLPANSPNPLKPSVLPLTGSNIPPSPTLRSSIPPSPTLRSYIPSFSWFS